MMRTNTIITIFMMLLLVPVFAQADITISKHENLFSAYAVEPTLQVCAGSSRTDVIRVSNDGEFKDTYDVSLMFADNVQDWARLSRNTFTLDAQEKQEYLIFFDIPFGEEGDYQFDVLFQSELGRDEQLQRVLRVEHCQNIKITVYAMDEQVLPCQPAHYRIEVENVADFGDNYRLDFGEYNEFARTNDELAFYLAPGEIKDIDVEFTRECGVYGDQNVPFEVQTADNQLVASTVDDYEILRKYSYSADLAQTHTVCADVATNLPFTVANHMYFDNAYDFDLKAPRFVTPVMGEELFDNDFTIEVPAESAQELMLVTAPSLDDVGTHNIELEAESVLGGVEKSYQSTLEVEPCYDFTALSTLNGLDDAKDTVCAGRYVYEFNVHNTGTRTQSYIVELHSPQWMKLEDNELTLAPGENYNVKVYVDTPRSDEEAEASLIVYNKEFPSIRREVSFALDVISSYTCHEPSLDKTTLDMVYETEVIPVIITNTGSQYSVYNIEYTQDFTTLSEQSLELGAGESGVVHLVASDDLYTFVEGGYPAVMTLTVTAPGDDYADGLTYQVPMKVNLKHKSWFTRVYEKIVYDTDYTAFSICQWFTLLFILVAVLAFLLMLAVRLGKMPGLGAFVASAPMTIIVIIAILALIVASFSIGAPGKEYEWQPKGSDYEGLYHEWGQNTNFVIDVSKYFIDPDGDSLRFTSSQPTDISVRIEGDYAILKPDTGFVGKNQIVFTAYDDKGGVTDSDIIDLFVVPAKDSNIFWKWFLWCRQVNIWLLILILVLVLLMRRRDDRDDDSDDDDDFDFSDLEDDEDEIDEEYESIFGDEDEKSGLKKEGGLFKYKPKKDDSKVEVVDLPKHGVFVASKNGTKVHNTSCMVVKRMPEENRAYFNVLEDAKKQGYKPCSICLKDEA